ncbi:Heat shock protein beta-1 [Orchesella cincta]|uniref:Heat shock protein beta-1 n=1 Tax=Orchesella cincta TaxID=48709 RepID=A0A1D2N6E7_ORCCI|nr:Heat shock protein beta-1 [Orchesella cincta]
MNELKMNNCNKLIPTCHKLRGMLVPARTICSRRALSPFNLMEHQMKEIDKQFTRLERDMNTAFRDWGFPFSRVRSIFEPSKLSNRTFPFNEAETSAGTEAGKPDKYIIRVDVGEGFAPEDIKVSLKERMITIYAKLEKKSEDGSSRLYQEVSRSFTLPETVNPEEVKSLFTPEGILTIEAPLPEAKAPKPKEIPINIESKN